MDPERFDPRKHSTVVVNVNEKVPSNSILMRSNEFPLRTFVVGPNTSSAAKLQRPSSAPSTGRKHQDPAAPRFLDKEGRWVAEELPVPVLATQAQPLSATTTIDAAVASSTVRTARGVVRPVSAVYSYADISPVITAEHVKDVQGRVDGATLVRTSSPTRMGSGGQPTLGGYYGRVDEGTQTYDDQAHQQYLVAGAQNQMVGNARGRAQSARRPSNGSGSYGAVPVRTPSAKKARPQTSSVYRSWPAGTSTAHGYARAGSSGMLTVPHAVPDHTLKPGQLGDPLPKPSYLTEIYSTGAYGARTGQGRAGQGHAQYQYGPVGNAAGGAVTSTQYNTHEGGVAVGDGAAGVAASGPYAAAANNPFWPKNATNLAQPDLIRIEELGRGVVAGSANSRLVGGRWRYMPRPVEGDVVYTDYYGPNGKQHADYYGRSYHVNSTEFAKHRLVNDSAYQRARASMMGIQALRDRPGLAMDAAIVHGPTEKLENVNAVTIPSARMHRITEYHNLTAAQRPGWVR